MRSGSDVQVSMCLDDVEARFGIGREQWASWKCEGRCNDWTVQGNVTLTEGEAAEAACAFLGLPRLAAVVLLRFAQELNGYLAREREALAAEIKQRLEDVR